MISSFKRGYRKDVSVGEFRVRMAQREANENSSHARRIAAKIVKIVKASGEVDDILLAGLARQYGCSKQLIPDTVEHTKRLLTA